MESTPQQDGIDVFIGVDVGKGEHHAVAVDRSGKRLFDKTLPNARRNSGRLSRNSKPEAAFCWWSISQPRSGRCP